MSDSIWIEAMMAEVESTYATDPTPVANTDDVVLAERVWPTMQVGAEWENLRDNVVSGTLLPIARTLPRGRLCRLNFAIDPRPKGSAYTAVTELRGTTALLRACGLSANVATSGIDFTWVSSAIESCTIWAYSGGTRYRLNGCRGRCRLVLEAGQPVMLRFEMIGLLRLDPDTASIPSITYLTSSTPSVVSSSLTVGSWSPDFERVELDFGQQVVVRPSGNATDGIAAIKINRHVPRLTMTAESVAIATQDPYTDAETPTSRTVACTIGSGTGVQIKLSGVTCYILSDPRKVDLGGFTGYEFTYQVTAGTLRFD